VKALRSDGDDDNPRTTEVSFRGRVLVSADGAPSKFARQKGYVNCEPEGVCSRAYITGDHKFNCDGVVFYPPELLPGYCSLLRHANNELGFCAYIIPGGPCTNNDLSRVHHDIIKVRLLVMADPLLTHGAQNDPFVSKALAGSNVTFERMKGASLRFGGIAKSWDDQFLIIGDAAGFIDPLTGEGIQYAMESGAYVFLFGQSTLVCLFASTF
jgi:flavin-dependent dehydrogenase